MGRILAIDYGLKRTGLAVTDIEQIISSPLITVRTHDLESFLKEYFLENEVDAVVLGYPKTLNNEPSSLVKHIDPFINRFKKVFKGMDLHLVDERFTSSIAQRSMIDGGMKKSDRRDKANVDRISASLILQSYMEQKKIANDRE